MKYLYSVILILFISVATYSQETPIQECARFLSKATDEASTCKIANAQKQGLIDAQAKLILKLEAVIEAKNEAIKAKDETIKILTEMKCTVSKTSIFLVFRFQKKKCF